MEHGTLSWEALSPKEQVTACPFEHLILTLSTARVDAYQHAGEARSSALENSELARPKKEKDAGRHVLTGEEMRTRFYPPHRLVSKLELGEQTAPLSLALCLSRLHHGGPLLARWWCDGESAGERTGGD